MIRVHSSRQICIHYLVLNAIRCSKVNMVKIAVLGAGINGLTCAVKIKEKFKDFHVVVIANQFTPHTTGDGSGGLWYPYLCGNTPEHLLAKWGSDTYKFLHELWLDGGCQICLMPIYELSINRDEILEQDWMKTVFGFQRFNKKQLEYFSQLYSANYGAGQTFVTFVSSSPKLLAYLQQRFLSAYGEIIKSKLASLEDPILSDYDVVVNCTGLGARQVVPDDKVVPIRGQVAKVQAPWLTETIMDRSIGNYIIPNADVCILGGTQQNTYNTQIDQKDTEYIISGCTAIVPGLKHAKLVAHWAGLRPGRDAVRLEKENLNGKLYIHNYGHGGSGLTLFWGCGNEVMRLLEAHLKETKPPLKMSKL